MPGSTPDRPRAFGAAALRTSMVVGTTLTIINHPAILSGLMPPGAAIQIFLNFLVPFLVAGFARQALLRELASRPAPAEAGRDGGPASGPTMGERRHRWEV